MVTRPCLVCGTPGTRGRCDNCGGRRTTARGYGADHQRRVAALRTQANPCALCGPEEVCPEANRPGHRHVGGDLVSRRDPRSHRRYVTTRAAWLPTARPVCCLCGELVDITLPGTSPRGPTVEHTLPIRRILAIASSWDETLALACDTSLWLLAHKVCQDRQGAAVGNSSPSRRSQASRMRRPSRAW